MGNEAELPGPAQWTHKTRIKMMPDCSCEMDRRREDHTTGCRDESEGSQGTQVASRNCKRQKLILPSEASKMFSPVNILI